MPNVQQTAFTSPGYDYSADISSIDRRRKLSEALQAQAMQGIQVPQTPAGGFTPRVSPMQGLEKLAQALMSATEGNRADQQARDLSAKSQSDYAQMVRTGLSQLQGRPATPMTEDASSNVTPAQPAVAADPAAAMATFGSHPMGQSLQPLAMQEMQRQRLMEALGGQQGGAAAPAGGAAPPAYGSPGFAPGAAAGPSGGNRPNLPLHLMTDSSGKSYVSALEKGGQTQGRQFIDQLGRAYTITGDGRTQYLKDERGNQIMARDKMEMADTGAALQPFNPYMQNQAIPKSLTPAQSLEIPMHQQRQWWETGMQPPGSATPQQRPAAPSPATPQPVPAPAQVPQPTAPVQRPAAPAPTAVPGPQAPPGGVPIPPRERAKLEEARPHQTQAAQTSVNWLHRTSSLIDSLEKQPGLDRILGPYASKTPNMTGAAANAQAGLDALKAQLSAHSLQSMRDASKTGGAVGSVTEKEWPRLESLFGALAQSQTPEEFRKNTALVKGELAKLKGSITQSYETVYGPLKMEQQGDPLGLR